MRPWLDVLFNKQSLILLISQKIGIPFKQQLEMVFYRAHKNLRSPFSAQNYIQNDLKWDTSYCYFFINIRSSYGFFLMEQKIRDDKGLLVLQIGSKVIR